MIPSGQSSLYLKLKLLSYAESSDNSPYETSELRNVLIAEIPHRLQPECALEHLLGQQPPAPVKLAAAYPVRPFG